VDSRSFVLKLIETRDSRLAPREQHAMVHQAPAARAGVISAGSFQLPYLIEGTGRPALAIGSARYDQRTLTQDLRSHLRFVLMDRRGFAPSPGPVVTSDCEAS
jgi:hypothetical protein